VSDSLVGLWSGSVAGPQGRTPLTLGFARDSTGRLLMTFDMPVMHCHAHPFDVPVEETNGQYRFGPLDMSWALEGRRLTGTFGRSGLPMSLRRGGRYARVPKPPTLAAGPRELWTVPLGAPTRATPVVRDGIVYVGASNGIFHAVRAADGAPVWTWTDANPIDGACAATEDAVLFVDRRIELVCLDRATGALRWRTALHDSTLAGGPAPENATFTRRVSTPLVLDGVVYAGSSDGGLYALDLASGEKRWRFDAGTPIFSAIGHVGGDTLSFGGMDGSLVLFDRAARRMLLRVHAAGPIVTTPLLIGRRLVAGSRDYQLYAFDVADTSRAWKYSYWFSWVESTPAVRGGTFWVGASDFRRVTAFEAATGRPRWSTDVRGMTWGTPLVTDKTVYAATAAQNFPGTVIDHQGGIVALDRATGKIRWRYAAPPPAENSLGGFAGSLALDQGRLIGARFDGTLIALPARD
jgi:outer membrane protein assembly factor BamB